MRQLAFDFVPAFTAIRVSTPAWKLWGYLEHVQKLNGWLCISLKYLAKHFQRSVGTVKNWFTELYRHKILDSQRRGSKPPLYRILRPQIVTCKPPHLLTECDEIGVSTRARERKILPMPERTPLPVGFDEQFQTYVGYFEASGKPLNRIDITRAHAVWTGLEPKDRDGAVADALQLCVERLEPRMIPFPVNHLLSQAWTRVAKPRTLPCKPPASEHRESRVERMIREICES